MEVQIKPVNSNKELKSFIHFPNKLYKNNPYFVPKLDFDEFNTLHKDKNPAFAHCQVQLWLAYRDGRIVGRIAGIINRLYIEKWQNRWARFGWFDFIDDEQVSAALLSTVESWAREKGMTAIHGPLGFTDLDLEGMLVEGFEELGTLATIYNYPYYPEHIKKAGYIKDIDWMEYDLHVPAEPDATISRVANIAMRRYNLRVLDITHKKQLLPHARDLFLLLNEAYSNLYGYVPLSDAQMTAYIKQYFGFIAPDFVPVIVDQNNQIVAFGITMPSLTRALQKARGKLFPFGFLYLLNALKKNDRADLYLVAVKPEYQGKGVNAIIIDCMNKVYNRLGITRVESNPELESNRLVQEQWKFFEKRNHKRRTCFIKHFHNTASN
ncbi:MAG TPA: GNAT family N-acetyltransferase [bacterium]|nr:GNAT family N-acetyltransferase [bacterium]HPN46179.1 GNAT family N-acetyltransferase [bacterium]